MLAISIDGLDSATQARLQRTLDGKLKQISARPASAIDDADREVIPTALRISAAKSLERRDGSSSELLLLKLVVRFVKAGRSLSTVELVDVILSFPRHATAIRRHILASLSPSALSELQQQVIEPLLRRLGAHVEPRVVYALQVLAGSFSTIAQMILSSSSASQVLNDAYASLQRSERPRNETVWCKSHILLLLHSLLGNLPLPEQEWKLALLNEDPSSSSSKTSARPLVNAGLADDYATFFRSKESLPVGDEEIRILETLQQPHNLATASVDSKVAPILSLFPQIPPNLVEAALEHPSFNGNAELLTNALLDGSLPPGLDALQASLSGVQSAQSPPRSAKYKRQNIFDDVPIDVSRLHIGKEEDDAELSALTSSIPDHIRSSILRLTEQQLAEAEAEEQAEREEAAARRERKAATRRTVREVGFEEELEAGADEEGEVVIGRSLRDGAEESEEEAEDVLNRGRSADDSTSVDSDDPETICERQYLISPNVFARTSRKTPQREDLKAKTGWSDEQLEGWRTMLERNPRKDKILARHEGVRQVQERQPQPPRQQTGDGRGRGGGGHRGGRGRGASKSSRGHQNAARTRGHDRKMQRMGAI